MLPEVINEELNVTISHSSEGTSVLEGVKRTFKLTGGKFSAKHNLIDGNFVVTSESDSTVTSEIISYRDFSHKIAVGIAPNPKKGFYPMVHSTREIENPDYTMERILYIKSLVYGLLGEIVVVSWQHVEDTIARKAGIGKVISALNNFFEEESLKQ